MWLLAAGLLQVVQTAALQQHPQLAGVVGDAGSLEAFAADIENEANTYFQRAYAGVWACLAALWCVPVGLVAVVLESALLLLTTGL